MYVVVVVVFHGGLRVKSAQRQQDGSEMYVCLSICFSVCLSIWLPVRMAVSQFILKTSLSVVGKSLAVISWFDLLTSRRNLFFTDPH